MYVSKTEGRQYILLKCTNDEKSWSNANHLFFKVLFFKYSRKNFEIMVMLPGVVRNWLLYI